MGEHDGNVRERNMSRKGEKEREEGTGREREGGRAREEKRIKRKSNIHTERFMKYI